MVQYQQKSNTFSTKLLEYCNTADGKPPVAKPPFLQAKPKAFKVKASSECVRPVSLGFFQQCEPRHLPTNGGSYKLNKTKPPKPPGETPVLRGSMWAS